MTEMTTHGIDTSLGIDASLPSPSTRPLDRIWPGAVVAIGLGATAAWLCLLTYGLIRLLDITF